MKSNCYYSEYQCPDHYKQDVDQTEDMKMNDIQKQSQTLVIKKSHGVTINQQEAQALIALQASLQAAIEAAITVFDAQDNADTSDLQRLDQQLKVLQLQKEVIAIQCSDDIIINQQQIQIDLVIQAVIQLLAKISAKIVEI